jgi:formamidopyrimidine-DNA glycosylase
VPELPEVECLTRAVRGFLEGNALESVVFYREDLRTAIPIKKFKLLLNRQIVSQVRRRSKYMLWQTDKGVGIFHLGMSGNMLLRDGADPQQKHTHAVFKIKGGKYLHYVDPRRFGIIDCSTNAELADHAYFTHLGPEPLESSDLDEHLFRKSRGKSQSIKTFLMDARVVVGVGNIYASESLFRAAIRPTRKAGSVTKQEFKSLSLAIKETLEEAICSGGTTLRDFKNADDSPGYFVQRLDVYGREGEPCHSCGKNIIQKRLVGRSTFYCKSCQK